MQEGVLYATTRTKALEAQLVEHIMHASSPRTHIDRASLRYECGGDSANHHSAYSYSHSLRKYTDMASLQCENAHDE